MPEKEQKILSVRIAGEWTSGQFANFLRSITDVYALCAIVSIEQVSLKEAESESGINDPSLFRTFPRRLRAAYRALGIRIPGGLSLIEVTDPLVTSELLEPEEQLYVKQIQYSSPGFADFAGLAAVLVPLLPFLVKLIELATTRERRRQEDKKIRIENARALVGLAGDLRDLGLSTIEIRKIINSVDSQQGKLLELAEQGKIQKVELPEPVSERENLHGSGQKPSRI